MCQFLKQADDKVKYFEVIGIDEGQFFPEIVEYAGKWADEGREIFVSGLDGDFNRKVVIH